jgi:hypothetical protein
LTRCCRASVRGVVRRVSSSSRWAPRLRLRSEERRPLVVAGLIALALLAFGEAAPAGFPVLVSIEGHGAALTVSVDGQSHTLSSVVGPSFRGISLEQPGPLEREYQIDGSDTTSTTDRQLSLIQSMLSSPLYRFDAWLRDEASFSRWEQVRVVDLATAQSVAVDAALPPDFRFEATLRRPEAPARLWLLGADDRREGLELDRDRRNARWLIQRGGGVEALPRWFFPENPWPFAADLAHLVGRGAAAGFALVVFAVTTAGLRGRIRIPLPGGLAIDLIMAVWLATAAIVSWRAYHQLPHILDAVSYTFQAGLLASGRVALPAPPLVEAFKGPFEVLWQGKLFSQYPPGAPAAYALGQLVGLEWLVGPLACLLLIAATSWTATTLFGPNCGLVVLALGALSPFVLFQSGSFLSHPIAGGLLAAALAAFVKAERDDSQRWFAICGALLGAGLLSREAASVLFAIPLGARLLATRHWRAASTVAMYGLPFVLVYLLYNAQLTGSPTVLPRSLFDPSDRFGFGDGIGFHTRHTLAAGLANTDEMLTLLQFDLFGWPPLFALGLLGVPFLLGRARTWDVIAATGFLTFVVAYTGYFYHGIALGPRYYFEAVPWLLLLAGRGAQVLAQVAGGRWGVGIVLGLLSLNSVFFYLPADFQRRTDLSGMPGGRTVSLGFVQSSLLGPQVIGVSTPALVLTNDWWLYNTALAALNCPRLPECDVLFALATTPNDVDAVRAQYPGRAVYRTFSNGSRVDLAPQS